MVKPIEPAEHPAKPLRPLPLFASEEEECDFWMTHDAAGYFDTTEPAAFTPPKRMPVALRFDTRLLQAVHALAAEEGVSWEALIHRWVWERAREEVGRRAASA
jgi:hypothetical protein